MRAARAAVSDPSVMTAEEQRKRNAEKRRELTQTQWEYGALPGGLRFSEHVSTAGCAAPLPDGVQAGKERAAAKKEMFERMVAFKYGQAGGEHLMWKGEEGFPGQAPTKWDPPPSAFPAHAPRRRGEARAMPDFDAIASSVRVEQKKSKERKIALNTAQWTTQEGRDAHYEQAPWSTVQGQSSADMAKAARAVGARGVLEQKAENRRRKIELNGGADAAASITSVGAQPRSEQTSETLGELGKGARKPAAEMIASKLLAKELKAKLTLTTCEDVLNEIPGF